MINSILKGLKNQKHKYIAKAISLVENADSLGNEILNDLDLSPMQSIKIGISGPPGAGNTYERF